MDCTENNASNCWRWCFLCDLPLIDKQDNFWFSGIRGFAQTHTQQGDLISLLSFLLNMESWQEKRAKSSHSILELLPSQNRVTKIFTVISQYES
jgi:hypothetical protein